jgi:hypothetical protein
MNESDGAQKKGGVGVMGGCVEVGDERLSSPEGPWMDQIGQMSKHCGRGGGGLQPTVYDPIWRARMKSKEKRGRIGVSAQSWKSGGLVIWLSIYLRISVSLKSSYRSLYNPKVLARPSSHLISHGAKLVVG